MRRRLSQEEALRLLMISAAFDLAVAFPRGGEMKIKVATQVNPADSVTLKRYDATTPPSKDDVLIIGGRGYYVSARSLYLDNLEPEWIVFVRPVRGK